MKRTQKIFRIASIENKSTYLAILLFTFIFNYGCSYRKLDKINVNLITSYPPRLYNNIKEEDYYIALRNNDSIMRTVSYYFIKNNIASYSTTTLIFHKQRRIRRDIINLVNLQDEIIKTGKFNQPYYISKFRGGNLYAYVIENKDEIQVVYQEGFKEPVQRDSDYFYFQKYLLPYCYFPICLHCSPSRYDYFSFSIPKSQLEEIRNYQDSVKVKKNNF